jgi:hypothetical protein
MRHIAFLQILIVVFFASNTFAAQSAKAQTIPTHINTTVTGDTYSYTVFNDESLSSSLYLYNITITLPSPSAFMVTQTPEGWTYDTDNETYLFFYTDDPSLPYPHHIAPQSSLGGFIIQATQPSSSQTVDYQINTWDHLSDMPGSYSLGTVLVPKLATVPAPSSSIPMTLGFGGLLFHLNQRRKRKA